MAEAGLDGSPGGQAGPLHARERERGTEIPRPTCEGGNTTERQMGSKRMMKWRYLVWRWRVGQSRLCGGRARIGKGLTPNKGTFEVKIPFRYKAGKLSVGRWATSGGVADVICSGWSTRRPGTEYRLRGTEWGILGRAVSRSEGLGATGPTIGSRA